MSLKILKRGDIYYYDFGRKRGSIQAYSRPAIVIQNDSGNKFSPTTIIAPITTRLKKILPTHVELFNVYIKANNKSIEEYLKSSVILLEQIFTVNKIDLQRKIAEINLNDRKFEEALKISLGIGGGGLQN